MEEDVTATVQTAYEEDTAMLVWWASEIECVSALARLERQGDLTGRSITVALERLDALRASWHEIEPVEAIRRTARRLLRVHDLRAADAFQLAAALVASEGQPPQLPIVSLDDRLVDAARREGFVLVDLLQR